MNARLKNLGIVLAILGLVFVAGGVFAFTKVQAGNASIAAFAEAQNVALTYNEEGQLVDRGDPEQGAKILSLLEDDWKYSVNSSELDPDDPIVNTASEYMVQMATIAYHTLNSTVSVTLADDAEDTEYNGVTYSAGDTVEFVNDGKYWTDFDRNNAIEGPARGLIWSATAHALIAELGVGSVTASTLQLGLGVSLLVAGIGGTFLLTGLGLIWAVRPPKVAAEKAAEKAPAKAAKK